MEEKSSTLKAIDHQKVAGPLGSALQDEVETEDKHQIQEQQVQQIQFQFEEPVRGWQDQKAYQDEPQDEEMEEVYGPPQRVLREEDEVNNILDAHSFVKAFSARAYSYKNKKILKQAYKKHMLTTATIKKVLKRMGERINADTDSDDSFEDSGYEDISRRALDSYRINKKK